MKFSEKMVSWLYLVLTAAAIFYVYSNFNMSKYTNMWSRARDTIESFSTAYNLMASPTPTPAPYVYHEPNAEQKKYLIALGAIISTYNNENTDTLKSNHSTPELKKLLVDFWEITDRESALVLLEWLENTGHRTEYSAMVDLLVRKNITTCRELQKTTKVYGDERDQLCKDEEIQKLHDFYANVDAETNQRTLFAWDYGRLVNVARWSYCVGYISEDEAWRYITPAGKNVQLLYHSWDDYGKNYLAGRDFWLQDTEASADFRRVFARLKDPKSQSVWMSTDWNTSFD